MLTLRSVVALATGLLTVAYLVDLRAILHSGVGLFPLPVAGLVRTVTAVSWVALIAVLVRDYMTRRVEEYAALVMARINNLERTLEGATELRRAVNDVPRRRHLSRVDNN
ncbi:hypothetical protein [Saccharothrix australiensis]|uniref:Uncharacterized protein n=1 Tax=Saccharothrix australiensis TaxID=2072 RepID=A0A495VJ50_9PSEU|nr:hypothetical protein [Saccharothrix australiensis]RKT49282.1 hypothetical protein C8E97_6778 [Saccharothrix australiensis]